MTAPSPPSNAPQGRSEDLDRLLPAIAAGEEPALGQLYDRTSRLVLSLAERLLEDPFSAEEVVLEVFRYAWTHAANYDPSRGSVVTWLLVVTRTRALDRRRADGRRRYREQPLDSETTRHEPADRVPSPAVNAANSEESETLTRSLERLSPDQRQVIELAFLYGRTHQSIAEELRQPLGTIKSRIRRGLLRLHEGLQGGDLEPGFGL